MIKQDAKVPNRSIHTITLTQVKAFFWQEQFFDSFQFAYKGIFFNTLGSVLIPLFNAIGNALTGYDRSSDPDFQSSFQVYPGSAVCNSRNAHSKWHEMSANFFVDLLFLVDDAFLLLSGKKIGLDEVSENEELMQCMVENDCFQRCKVSSAIEWDLGIPNKLEMIGKCFASTSPSEVSQVSLGNCILSALFVPSVVTVDVQESPAKVEYLDTCLLVHGCLVFQESSFDIDLLQWCIQTENFSHQEARCGSFVNDTNASELIRCTIACRGNLLCLSGCLYKTGSLLSSSFEITSTCLNALLLVPETNADYAYFQAACQQWSENERFGPDEISPVQSTLMDSLVQSLPWMTTCIMTKCNAPYRNSPIRQALSCAAACSLTDLPLLACLNDCF